MEKQYDKRVNSLPKINERSVFLLELGFDPGHTLKQSEMQDLLRGVSSNSLEPGYSRLSIRLLSSYTLRF